MITNKNNLSWGKLGFNYLCRLLGYGTMPAATEQQSTPPEPSLEDLLKEVMTVEGRVKIVERLVGKVAVPAKYVDEAISFYESKYSETEYTGNLQQAGDIALKARRPQQAMELYERAKNFKGAAEVALELEDTDKAIENYIMASIPAQAAWVAKNAGREQQARELLAWAVCSAEIGLNLTSAADSATRAGFHEKARAYSSLSRLLSRVSTRRS